MTNREGRPITSYRDLRVWQKAHELAKEVIAAAGGLPGTDGGKVIRTQMLRCATSIPANIAEGYGGAKGRAFRNSLVIARREANEMDYWLLLTVELGWIDAGRHTSLEKGYAEVRAMLTSFIEKLTRTLDS